MNKAQCASPTAVLTAKSSNPKPTKSMLLRFDVDQAECFRRGIDCPKSTATIEVKPSELSVEERSLIADRMNGIDVCQLKVLPGTKEGIVRSSKRIKASTPDYKGLIEAVANDNKQLTGVESFEYPFKNESDIDMTPYQVAFSLRKAEAENARDAAKMKREAAEQAKLQAEREARNKTNQK